MLCEWDRELDILPEWDWHEGTFSSTNSTWHMQTSKRKNKPTIKKQTKCHNDDTYLIKIPNSEVKRQSCHLLHSEQDNQVSSQNNHAYTKIYRKSLIKPATKAQSTNNYNKRFTSQSTISYQPNINVDRDDLTQTHWKKAKYVKVYNNVLISRSNVQKNSNVSSYSNNVMISRLNDQKNSNVSSYSNNVMISRSNVQKYSKVSSSSNNVPIFHTHENKNNYSKDIGYSNDKYFACPTTHNIIHPNKIFSLQNPLNSCLNASSRTCKSLIDCITCLKSANSLRCSNINPYVSCCFEIEKELRTLLPPQVKLQSSCLPSCNTNINGLSLNCFSSSSTQCYSIDASKSQSKVLQKLKET